MTDRVIFIEPGTRRRFSRFGWGDSWEADDLYGYGTLGGWDAVSSNLRDRHRSSCASPDCSAPGGHAGTMFCQMHAFEVWRKLDESMSDGERGMIRARHEEAVAKARAVEEVRRLRPKAKPPTIPRDELPGMVYYLLVGDLVKIGWASILADRMKQYPPNSILLAAHPGTLKTERQMHHRHLDLLDRGREWFRPGVALIEHVGMVRSEYDCPLAVDDDAWRELRESLADAR